MPQENEDYASLADPEFQPYQFCNDLLSITNSNIQNELDVSTSIKKVKFDLNDLDSQITSLVNDDADDLIIKEFLEKKDSDSEQFQKLQDNLTSINSNFKRLKNDLLKPYGQIELYLNILRRIHNTSFLTRDMTYCIHLISKINQLDVERKERKDTAKDDELILKLSELYSNLTNHLSTNKNLRGLKIIRDYEPINERKLDELENELTQVLNALLNDCISTGRKQNLLSKEPSLLVHFRTYCRSLQVLNPQKLEQLLVKFEKNVISISLNNHLTKISTSSTQSIKISKDVAFFFIRFAKLLQILKTIKLDSNSTLFTLFQNVTTSSSSKKAELSDFYYIFWSSLFLNYKPLLKATISRGGPVLKQLKSNKEEVITTFQNEVQQTFKTLQSEDEDESDLSVTVSDITDLIKEVFDEVDKK